MRARWLVIFVVVCSSCWKFDELEQRALCRVDAGPCEGFTGDDGGAGGGDGGGDGGPGTDGGGVSTDAFTDGGPELRALSRGSLLSESGSVDAFDTTIAWNTTRGCDGGVSNPQACGRNYSVHGGVVTLRPAGNLEEADLPLSSAVGPNVFAFLSLGGGGGDIELSVNPQDTRGLGGAYAPVPTTSRSGAVAWLGPGRQLVAAFIATAPFSGLELRLWHYDYDALNGVRLDNVASPTLSLDPACEPRVDDGARTLRADGSPTGALYFAVARPDSCASPGVTLVVTDGGTPTALPLTLPVARLRLASGLGTLWAASPLDGGGSELRGFEINADGLQMATPSVWQYPALADWHLADVTADRQGRPYLLGDGSSPDGGPHAVWISGYELDGGVRFMFPLPGSQQARAVGAAWSSRGLVVAGDCDAGSIEGVCKDATGAFLTIVRVPR